MIFLSLYPQIKEDEQKMEDIFLKKLNKSQREAVEYIDGASLVVAGAGSGKTRVLTYKIAYLLARGIAPWNILALTFTNKASKEMKERIGTLVGENKARYLWMGTFHSVFYRILRTEAEAIGYQSNFTIYDSSDAKSLIKSIVKEMQLDDKKYKPGTVANRISKAKNQLLMPNEYAANTEAYQIDKAQQVPAVRDIYRIYAMRCRQAQVMDFDDLLLYTYKLFTSRPDICLQYAERFQYILVDEYQDTNIAQHKIVWELSKLNQKICVVGDDAQSIYGFRGADIDNILQFSERYKNARIFKLEQNYRSTQNIVDAANSVISHNKSQIKKKVFSKNEIGEPLVLTSAYSDIEEGEIVCNQISSLHSNKELNYSEIAILYRTNAQSRVFEEALRKRAIPYKIYGGLSFYQRKEIKDVIAYFRLVINPYDEEAFKRIINYPARGIGETTVNKLMSAAIQQDVSLWKILESPETYNININKGTAQKLASFYQMMQSFLQAVETEDASVLGCRIIKEAGIMNDFLKDATPEGQNRRENITELVNGLQNFVDLQREEDRESEIQLIDYMQQVSLLTDADKTDENTPKVALMTIHSAKGLEFGGVFVVGLEDGLFPNANATYNPIEKEEERRLFYVAITRAKEYCYLSFSKSRFHYGKMEFSNPSCFLYDIDSRYIQTTQQAFSPKKEKKENPFTLKRETPTTHSLPTKPRHLVSVRSKTQQTDLSSDTNTLRIGQHIEHKRFGVGEILHLEGKGENCKATVAFQNTGEKTLLLKFARFEVLD